MMRRIKPFHQNETLKVNPLFFALLAFTLSLFIGPTSFAAEGQSPFKGGMSHKTVTKNEMPTTQQTTSNIQRQLPKKSSNFIRRRFDENGQLISSNTRPEAVSDQEEQPDKIWNSYKKIMEEVKVKQAPEEIAEADPQAKEAKPSKTSAQGLQMILEQYKRSRDARSQVRSLQVSE